MSGPGDLNGKRFDSLLQTALWLKRILSQKDIVSTYGMDGATSLYGSLVNTDEKQEARTSAFLLSVVADNLILSSKYVRSHIPDLVLVLD